MQILWFIPTHTDWRYLATPVSRRYTSLDYLLTVARAIDSLGYAGALIPTGQICEDAWVTASMLAAHTRQMKFLIAVRPGTIAPVLAARMAATFDRMSEGRLMLNIISGGDPVELAGEGTFMSHDERYAVTDEFMDVFRALLRGEDVTHEGTHYRVEGGKLLQAPFQQPYPPIYFGGSSSAGHETAAKHADVYLTHAEPPDAVAEKIADVRRRAAAHGREIRVGVRAHMIVRETDAEAWAAAADLLKYVDHDAIRAAQSKLERFDSVGQARMRALNSGAYDGDPRSLEIAPNLWAGVGLVNKGIGTAIVGDADTVAARLQAYADLGADTFILSAYPHLEEAYRVAELVFPRLPALAEKLRADDRVFQKIGAWRGGWWGEDKQ